MADREVQGIGERAARNTIVRTLGDVVARVASLVLFAVMARKLGQGDLGVFVFALAFVQIITMPVGFGFDRYMLREIAGDRGRLGALFYDVIAVKALLALPIAGVCALAVSLLGYGATTRQVVYVLAVGVIVELLTRTVTSVFEAYEQGRLWALALVVQRLTAAAMGLTALALGFGVVTIALTYTVSAVLALALAVVLMVRHVGFPPVSLDTSTWRELGRRSFPFGMQDVFGVLLFRVDTVLLSVLASASAVGLYGSAYRLFEASFVFTWALTGSFTPMFVYLGEDTQPTIRQAFGQALKAGLAVLIPCALIFGLLAEPLSRLFFGDGFIRAADPLRILAPVVVLIGMAFLASSLIASRTGPERLVPLLGFACVLNILLNIALVPTLQDVGAAYAMLFTEVVIVILMLRVTWQEVGNPPWRSILVGPVAAGAAMVLPLVLLADQLVPAAAAGLVVYAAVLLGVERLVNPADLQTGLQLVRRRLSRAEG